MKKLIKPIKVVVCGSGAIGKTTICQRLAGTLDYNDIPNLTPGIEIHKYKMESNEHRIAALWDLGGQDRFRFIQSSYTIGAQIAIIVFSVEWIHSVNDLKNWLSILPKNPAPQHYFLIANKVDSPNRVVLKNEVEDLILKNDMKYFEVSAKNGFGFNEFKDCFQQTLNNIDIEKNKNFVSTNNLANTFNPCKVKD